MKRFLKLPRAAEPDLEPPVVGGADAPLSDAQKRHLRRPIIAGGLVIGIFVLGLGIWASVSPVLGAVIAPGQVRVESSRKTLKAREVGVVRGIYVRDGDQVAANQVVLRFDDVVAKAQVSILSNQQQSLLAQQARFAAEALGRNTLTFPPELLAQRADPRVAMIVQNEEFLFRSRLATVEGQVAILNQRILQLRERQTGVQVQIDSIDEQARLSREELQGYQTLYDKGYAPKTLILRLQRAIAESNGRRGSLVSEMTRTQEQIGETRMQLASVYQQRQSEAAEGKRQADAQLADINPRLGAAREALAHTEVRAPVAGFVLNMTQHTLGGVAGAGEPLMDVVPANAPLVVVAEVNPRDIDEVTAGMMAQVELASYSSLKVPKVEARVLTVSADALTNAKTGEPYFIAELKIDPSELKRLPKGVKLYPGMPANVMIITGKRTIMSFLLGPIGDIIDHAMRES